MCVNFRFINEVKGDIAAFGDLYMHTIFEEDSAEHGNRAIRDSLYSIRQQKKNKKENE